MKASEVLRKAKGFIDAPEKWADRGRWAEPKRMCAGVALVTAGLCDRSLFNPATEFLGLAIGLPDPVNTIPFWNDAPERTHAEVLSAFDRAIALAEKDEGRESDTDYATRMVREVTNGDLALVTSASTTN